MAGKSITNLLFPAPKFDGIQGYTPDTVIINELERQIDIVDEIINQQVKVIAAKRDAAIAEYMQQTGLASDQIALRVWWEGDTWKFSLIALAKPAKQTI